MRLGRLVYGAIGLACCWGCGWPGGPGVLGGSGARAGADSDPGPATQVTTGETAGPSRGNQERLERPGIAVLPFVDASGFRPGVWDLPQEMARLVRTELAAGDRWRVVAEAVTAGSGLDPREAEMSVVAAWGRQVRAEVVLQGRITGYALRRFTVGDPLLGGYKAYSAEVELEVEAVWAGTGRVTLLTSRQELSERGAAVELLGKPRDADLEFERMPALAFGSVEFRATLLGRATVAAVSELLAQVDRAADSLRTVQTAAHGEILSVEGTEVFLSVGREAGAWVGQRYWVEGGHPAGAGTAVVVKPTDPRPSGAVVEVVEVVGARLSRGRLVEGVGAVQPGDQVRAVGSTETGGAAKP